MTKIGYARCSTDKQDLTAQRQVLCDLGVSEDLIYTDHGLTGTNRARPGLDQALAAVREGDVLVVPKLDRLARSVPDARAIAEQLEKKGVKLALGMSIYDPTDPMGKMFFNILATFAEFEADLIRLRTREGMAIAVQRANSVENSQNSLKNNRKNSPACMQPASILSVIWLSCSRSPGQRFTEPCTAQGPKSALSVLFCPLRHQIPSTAASKVRWLSLSN